jgi:uncharacterized cysteine cluster protein YcgN (CxxCxxCC family)
MMNVAEVVGSHLDKLAEKQDLEKYCVRCGECCHASVIIQTQNGPARITIPELPCKFLEDNNCTVYEDRFKQAPWCQDLYSAAIKGLLSTKVCPYVNTLENYHGAQRLSSEQYEKYKPVILKVVLSAKDHDAFKPEDFERFSRGQK